MAWWAYPLDFTHHLLSPTRTRDARGRLGSRARLFRCGVFFFSAPPYDLSQWYPQHLYGPDTKVLARILAQGFQAIRCRQGPHGSASADDKAIACWVADHCLIMPPTPTKYLPAGRLAGSEASGPIRVGARPGDPVITTDWEQMLDPTETTVEASTDTGDTILFASARLEPPPRRLLGRVLDVKLVATQQVVPHGHTPIPRDLLLAWAHP